MPETAEQYIARIISNLGTQDPMQVLAATPSRIGALIAWPIGQQPSLDA